MTLDREADDTNPDDQLADAPLFPHKKMVSWWLVVGDRAQSQGQGQGPKSLYAIKKVTVKERLEVRLDFNLPAGKHALKLFLICDSYAGADQDFELDEVDVAEGDSDEEEDDSDEDEDGEGGGEPMDQD